jgi:hypothetical protein
MISDFENRTKEIAPSKQSRELGKKKKTRAEPLGPRGLKQKIKH